jgi:hypothetical protein
LWFSNDAWQLIAELKINAKIDPRQIRSYLHEAHTLVVVRRSDATKQLDATVTGDPRWLGHVTWNSIREPLYDLMPGAAHEPEWRGLLDVMTRDHDFANARPGGSRELQLAKDLLTEVREPVVEHLRVRLRERDGIPAEPACERLRAFSVRAYAPWAWFHIGFAADDPRIEIQLKGLFTGSPTLELRYQPQLTGSRKLRRESYREFRALEWTEDSVQGLADTESIHAWCCQRVTELVDAGAFQADHHGVPER